MTGPLVLGIDLGLTGARAAVMDSAGAVLAASDHHQVPARTGFGRAEHDPADWLTAMAGAAAAAAAGFGERIEAIGVSALGPAPVLVTEDLTPLTPALLFSLDTRAEEQRGRLAARLGLREDQLNHDHAIPKLLWWREHHPGRWERAAWALDATGFLVGRLTGVPVMDAITACDYRLPGCACPVAVPEPADPLSVAGGLTGEWARRLGLRSGIDVLTGTYDSYADSAATGTLAAGDACIIFGSTLIIGVVLDELPAQMDGLVAAPHLGSGLLAGGWTATGCSALDWAVRLAGRAGPDAEALVREASSIPAGADGLIFLPYLAGERSPVHDPAARGVLLGLTSATTAVTLYRAVIDGLALSIRDHAERLAAAGARPPRWRGTGGGTRNRLLMQAASDALAAPVEVIAGASEPVGPCRMALRGIGAEPPVAVAETVVPDPRAAERYDQLYGVYRVLYSTLSEQMHMLTGMAYGGRQ